MEVWAATAGRVSGMQEGRTLDRVVGDLAVIAGDAGQRGSCTGLFAWHWLTEAVAHPRRAGMR